MHVRAHTGDKRFVCQFPNCGAKFMGQHRLDHHFRAYHTAEGIGRHKRQEHRIALLLVSMGVCFKREHSLHFCDHRSSAAKVDFVITKGPLVIFLEVDEDQHDSRDVGCDAARMANIVESLTLGGNSLPIGIIRYNPNAFKVDLATRPMLKSHREERLKEVIETWEQDTPLQIQYMYYNSHTQGDSLSLDIWDDQAFPDELVTCCRPPIV